VLQCGIVGVIEQPEHARRRLQQRGQIFEPGEVAVEPRRYDRQALLGRGMQPVEAVLKGDGITEPGCKQHERQRNCCAQQRTREGRSQRTEVRGSLDSRFSRKVCHHARLGDDLPGTIIRASCNSMIPGPEARQENPVWSATGGIRLIPISRLEGCLKCRRPVRSRTCRSRSTFP